VKLRNDALQQVLAKLMLATGTKKGDSAGYISYAQLGINQLGAVYEGLMAYTGFFATGDLFEVAKGGDLSGGTWMLPVADADEYPDDVFVTAENPTTGRNERVRHNKGSFVSLAVEHRPGNAGANTIADLVGIIDDGLDAPSESVGRIAPALCLLTRTTRSWFVPTRPGTPSGCCGTCGTCGTATCGSA
ncbi:MAG: hypothetical protein WA988_14065, partial [Candidatus Nanopelagicales bacterium]